MQTVGPDMAR